MLQSVRHGSQSSFPDSGDQGTNYIKDTTTHGNVGLLTAVMLSLALRGNIAHYRSCRELISSYFIGHLFNDWDARNTLVHLEPKPAGAC